MFSPQTVSTLRSELASSHRALESERARLSLLREEALSAAEWGEKIS